MVAALITKLIILLGVKYERVYKLPYDAYRPTEGTITINDVTIKLPNSYRDQLEIYLEATRKYEHKFLFVKYGGKELKEKTSSSGISDFISSRINSYSVDSLVKAGIQQLIAAEVNDNIIRKVTGAQNKIMEDCYKEINYDNDYLSLYFSSKLEKTDYYD
jgi:hypothetical protein